MHLTSKLGSYLRMIKFSHSVFALPFAFTGAMVASNGFPGWRKIFFIVIAMVSARSGAMGLNRIIDRRIDALNPRTMNREIPRGVIRVSEAYIFVIISLSVLLFAAYMLNPLCLKLSPIALAVLFLYSYTKRFTWASHFILGLVLSAAPIGAWVAIRGTLNARILPLGIAVIFWLAGFDTLYALQDLEFDKTHGLYSIPLRFGVRKSLILARFFHIIAWLLLMLTGVIFRLGTFYWIGMAIVAMLFVYEHSLVKEDALKRLDVAFFNMNGYISITVFLFTLLCFV